MMRLSKNFI